MVGMDLYVNTSSIFTVNCKAVRRTLVVIRAIIYIPFRKSLKGIFYVDT